MNETKPEFVEAYVPFGQIKDSPISADMTESEEIEVLMPWMRAMAEESVKVRRSLGVERGYHHFRYEPRAYEMLTKGISIK